MNWLHVESTWDGQPIPAEERVTVGLRRTARGLKMFIEAPHYGDPLPPGPPGPTEGLWQFEVVELFLCGPGERYLEVELGPGGHHLVLLLEGIRNPVHRGLPLEVLCLQQGGFWVAATELPQAWLPPEPWRANAYAIHGVGDSRRYLAHAPVPGPAPDFHRLQHFPPLDLEAP